MVNYCHIRNDLSKWVLRRKCGNFAAADGTFTLILSRPSLAPIIPLTISVINPHTWQDNYSRSAVVVGRNC